MAGWQKIGSADYREGIRGFGYGSRRLRYAGSDWLVQLSWRAWALRGLPEDTWKAQHNGEFAVSALRIVALFCT